MSDDYRGQARTDVVLVEAYLNKGDHGAAADYLQGRLKSTHERGRREENEGCAKIAEKEIDKAGRWGARMASRIERKIRARMEKK